MSYWIKHFVDARNEVGRDTDVMSGKASWSRGRLEGITSATLSYAGTVVVVPGREIWQKDQYGGVVGSTPQRLSRSLGTKITQQDVGKKLYLHGTGRLEVYYLTMADIVPGDFIAVQPDHVGQWAVVTIKQSGKPVVSIEEKYRV